MHMLLEWADGNYYADVVLSVEDIHRIQKGEMIEDVVVIKNFNRIYIGIRGETQNEKESWPEED